ncbi:hypothetical protein, partial [Neisseria sicca]|uniref:hypothetical protein n=1 Tax=Neisseria sicca TaxID=490 RepID=UPI000B8CEBB6
HGLCGLPEEGAHEKSPKCLGGNLGDFGEFCKGLEVKSSLHVENAVQANLRFAALSLTLSHGERGWGCRLLLGFRQFLTLVEAVL